MKKLTTYAYLYCAILLAGCASVSHLPIPPSSSNPDAATCIGKVMAPPAGLEEDSDAALLQSAEGAAGQGKLCTGKVFVVRQPVRVYRVWDSSASYTALGRWWSFALPTGPRDKYREQNEICPSWSALDRMSFCTLKVGTKIVVGPGQSATCTDTTYPQSEVNQVYVPNDSKNNQVFVENCSTGVDWPTVAQ